MFFVSGGPVVSCLSPADKKMKNPTFVQKIMRRVRLLRCFSDTQLIIQGDSIYLSVIEIVSTDIFKTLMCTMLF